MKKNKISKENFSSKVNSLLSTNSTPEEIKKLKKLAMSNNIRLKDKRKSFCKNCNHLFNSTNSEIRIINDLKRIKCLSCGYITRFKIK